MLHFDWSKPPDNFGPWLSLSWAMTGAQRVSWTTWIISLWILSSTPSLWEMRETLAHWSHIKVTYTMNHLDDSSSAESCDVHLSPNSLLTTLSLMKRGMGTWERVSQQCHFFTCLANPPFSAMPVWLLHYNIVFHNQWNSDKPSFLLWALMPHLLIISCIIQCHSSPPLVCESSNSPVFLIVWWCHLPQLFSCSSCSCVWLASHSQSI